MRDNFKDPRDYDVLVQTPELFAKDNNQKGALNRQLRAALPITKVSGLNFEDRQFNSRIKGLLSPERIDGISEEVHHKNALSLLGTVINNANDSDRALIYKLLEDNEISIGNDIRNLINLNIDDHDELHNFAREQGLEMQGKGTKGLAAKLMNSTNISDTITYLQDYIDYGIPLLQEKADELITARENRKAAKNIAYQYKRLKS